MAEQEQQTPSEAGDSSQAQTEPGPELDLAARVAELEAQIKDTQLRSMAEVQNIHRRAERDVDSARKYALEKFAGALLDVADNLERALGAAPAEAESDSVKALRDGVALTHKQMVDVLKRFGVEQQDPLGQPFNAELHQAVSMQPSSTAEPNSVTAVLAKGYTLSGRLLRPAMVVVATAG